jgi:hypothetical protein
MKGAARNTQSKSLCVVVCADTLAVPESVLASFEGMVVLGECIEVRGARDHAQCPLGHKYMTTGTALYL